MKPELAFIHDVNGEIALIGNYLKFLSWEDEPKEDKIVYIEKAQACLKHLHDLVDSFYMHRQAQVLASIRPKKVQNG